jgi:hypothetical protein
VVVEDNHRGERKGIFRMEMKTTKRELQKLMAECVRQALNERFRGGNYTVTTISGLEIGPVDVEGEFIAGDRGSMIDPPSSGEVIIQAFILDGEQISLEDLLTKENEFRAQAGEPPIGEEELLSKAEQAISDEMAMRMDDPGDYE